MAHHTYTPLPTPAHPLFKRRRQRGGSSANMASNFISEAVIGSLPKGLSAEERMAVAGSVPQSPAVMRLASITEVSHMATALSQPHKHEHR